MIFAEKEINSTHLLSIPHIAQPHQFVLLIVSHGLFQIDPVAAERHTGSVPFVRHLHRLNVAVRPKEGYQGVLAVADLALLPLDLDGPAIFLALLLGLRLFNLLEGCVRLREGEKGRSEADGVRMKTKNIIGPVTAGIDGSSHLLHLLGLILHGLRRFLGAHPAGLAGLVFLVL